MEETNQEENISEKERFSVTRNNNGKQNKKCLNLPVDMIANISQHTGQLADGEETAGRKMKWQLLVELLPKQGYEPTLAYSV